MKARKYYILVGKLDKNSPFEMIFGDYDRSVVVDEKADTSDYVSMKVVTLQADNQAAIDAYMASIN